MSARSTLQRSIPHRLPRIFKHAHYISRRYNPEFLAGDLELATAAPAEQDLVAGFHANRNELAELVAAAPPDGDDFPHLRHILSGVPNDDAAARFFQAVDVDYDLVVCRTKSNSRCP